MTNESRQFGTCKWFSIRRGYGFIAGDNGEDLFVHYSNIEGRENIKTQFLEVDDRVSYIPTREEKGLSATCVRVELSEGGADD